MTDIPYAGPERRAATPPEGTPVVQQVPPEDLVEQTLQKAADKVASVTIPGGPPIMNRTEAIASVAVIVILLLSNIFIDLRTYTSNKAHRQDFRTVCQIIVNQAPPETAKELATSLAECLD